MFVNKSLLAIEMTCQDFDDRARHAAPRQDTAQELALPISLGLSTAPHVSAHILTYKTFANISVLSAQLSPEAPKEDVGLHCCPPAR